MPGKCHARAGVCQASGPPAACRQMVLAGPAQAAHPLKASPTCAGSASSVSMALRAVSALRWHVQESRHRMGGSGACCFMSQRLDADQASALAAAAGHSGHANCFGAHLRPSRACRPRRCAPPGPCLAAAVWGTSTGTMTASMARLVALTTHRGDSSATAAWRGGEGNDSVE